MINAHFLLKVKQITGNFQPNFGGLDIILIGDLRQLPPVHSTPIYKQPKQTVIGQILWRNLTFYEFEFTSSRSEVVFLKFSGIGNSAFLLAAAFAYLFSRILAPDSVENRVSFALSSFLLLACDCTAGARRFVITDEFIYDNQQSVRELINLRDSYAIWARKLSIVPATSDEYTATSAELGNIHTALLAPRKG
ncbi:ATP-dependent DNA helicase [Trichonephila clavipes]|nr:ATP-dependent DNA helicase [Trichonephila clavipes]